MKKLQRTPAVLALVMLATVLGAREARAFTLRVVDGSGAPVSGFRWLVEEDTTIPVTPGVRTNDIPALSLHGSYAPVVARGSTSGAQAAVLVPSDRRYLVSILSLAGGHTLSGAPVAVGQGEVTVRVSAQPIPTAQISVLVFNDRQPLNGAPDVPAEPGLAGFSLTLSDVAGQVSQDAFGNPLGTSYQQASDGTYVVDAEGNPVVAVLGSGVILSGANGEALIRHLPPGKYGVRAVPPLGSDWVQTATIEGTPTIDAWVKAGEPPYFAEWGAFDHHAFIGFVRPLSFAAPTGAAGELTGRMVYVHENRPPLQPGLHPGVPVEDCWVGLNALGAADELVYARPCGPGGLFHIEGIPPGVYQLALWDRPLDAIIDFRTITIPPAGGLLALGDVPVYAWFGFLEGSVFYDADRDGYRDPGEVGLSDQAINLRFPDGSVYQTTKTDPRGSYRLREVFPFFHWLVAEVDYTRYQPTGLTAVIDEGGPLAPGARSHPQPQPTPNPNTGDTLSRTETGEVLTQGVLLYAGQTHTLDWGKAVHAPRANGGISGLVHYATTRAENDPRYAVGENWEPKVPRVQVELYADTNRDNVIDDLNRDSRVTLADVDNHPFGDFPGPGDVDRDGDGVWGAGDALNVTHTDSWDDSLPTGCVGPPQVVGGQPVKDCAETLRTWSQLRPGVFDGGYLFGSYFPGGMASGSAEVAGLPSGTYIVQAVPPPGYETVKEEDKNVDFGEQTTPHLIAAPPCVGEPHRVPAELSLFPGVEAPFAGTDRPLCDRKQVLLSAGRNTAADFFVFTEVPKAGRIWGVVLNDVLLEFNPDSPQKGTNFGVPWLPISIQDFQGREVVRTYSDEWGHYNALVPSTYSVNRPTPSGVSPGMLTVCLNDPGPIPDPTRPGQFIRDPWHNPAYGRVCTQWEFFPGKTTRLDTPILPIAAFTANRQPLDCEFPDGTPLIHSVRGPTGGPLVPRTGGFVTLQSVGPLQVPDPGRVPDVPGRPPTITRDYGFGGTRGRVTLDDTPLPIVNWAPDGSTIVVRVPASARTGQLQVQRSNGRASGMGVTLHVGPSNVVRVSPGGSLQAAIDGAPRGALILVAPGTYKQNPIVWKDVQLQGWGAFSTLIEAGPLTPDEQAAWDAKLQALITAGEVALIPGERPDFFLERGAGVTVVSRPGRMGPTRRVRIDGFTLTGAIKGGGIFANAYARYLTVSNNRLISNQGSFGGGIRVGTPSLVNAAGNGYLGSGNDHVSIHHNHITQNGGIDGGGGVALFNGSDAYSVTDNFICGNFTLLYGGGLAHFGLSDEGVIARNRLVSNQSFDEGGGLLIAGELVPAGAPPGTLTPGSGGVKVLANLIQGNLAGDDGGGVRTLLVNGQDVQRSPNAPARWYAVSLFNNLIVNNSSADTGGGLALDDTARAFIVHNTIAHNDSTATGVDAFGGPCIPNEPPGQFCAEEGGDLGGITTSVPQVAGIAARAHSAGLQAAFGPGVAQEYANPLLFNNILWHNRAFYWDAAYRGGLGGLRPDLAAGEAPHYWDLAVYGTSIPRSLEPHFSLLSEPTPGDDTNVAADPSFVAPYLNTYQATSKGSAFGNFVTTTFLPTGLVGDYHLGPGSPASGVGLGTLRFFFPELWSDFDGDPRQGFFNVDAGADERP